MKDPAILEAVNAVEECGGNKQAAARMLGIARSTLRGRIRRAEAEGVFAKPEMPKQQEGKQWAESDDSASLVLTTTQRIRTVEEALLFAEVDQDVWEPQSFQVTSHEQGQKDDDGNPTIIRLWNVKVKLRRRADNHPLRVKTEVMDMLVSYAPKIPSPSWKRSKKRGQLMLEIACPDIHMGKLADAEETGHDYNLEIARNLYLKAHSHILNEASSKYDIGQILNIPANDIMHFAGSRYSTTRGTRQDTSGTWQRVYRTARETACDGVMLCRNVAPVKVISHPDNHANDEAFYIGDALWCYFNRDKHVEVDHLSAPYKFHRHGNCLIGFGHGDAAKYPELQSVMARACPVDYAQCKVKEFHLGHLHKEMLIDSWGDLMFRRLSSLSGTDSWHARMGYGSPKSAMGFVWSQEGLESIIYFTPSAEDYVA
jgi:transposase-like protein